MKKHWLALLAILLPLVAGCAEDTLAVPALDVEIRDVRTGAPAWYNATMITVRDGIHTDTMRGRSGLPPEYKNQMVPLSSRADRPGTYDVTITHPEYHTWHRKGIRVEKSGKLNPFDASPLPKTVHVLAELQPLDGQ